MIDNGTKPNLTTTPTALPRRAARMVAPLLAGTVGWILAAVGPLSPDPAHGSANSPSAIQPRNNETVMTTSHPYVGMWVTADGHVRQELLPNGRYDEARGTRASAYQGRYEVRGTHIDYWDDTGFTADGTFVTHDELHHGEMIFFRER